MNFSKSLIFATAFLSLATISSASVVPSGTAFNVSGVFQNNAVLSGSFDITGGQITSANMTISVIPGTFTLDEDGGGSYHSGVWRNVDLSDGDSILVLDLVLQPGATNLQTYTGGALCDTSGNCGSVVSHYTPHQDDPPLSSGNVSSAPEPASTGLLGAGLMAIGFMARRFAKK